MDDEIVVTNLSAEDPDSQPRNPVARGARWVLAWGRANPVAAGWIGACLFLLVLFYVHTIAVLVARDASDGDGGSEVAVTPPAPAPVTPAPTPPVEPAPVVPVAPVAPTPASDPAQSAEPHGEPS